MRPLFALVLATTLASAAPADAGRRCDRRGLEAVVANERVMVLSRTFHEGEVETDGRVDWELTARGRLVVLDGGQRAPWESRHIGRVRVTGTTGEHLLASGDDLDQGTLTVEGDRARWTRGGVAESAGIP